MKRWVVALAALSLLFALSDSVTASGAPETIAPPKDEAKPAAPAAETIPSSTIPCSTYPSACSSWSYPSTSYCSPTYTTAYQSVSRTVCELQPVTTEQEVTIHEQVPEKRTEKRTEEWYEAKQVHKK